MEEASDIQFNLAKLHNDEQNGSGIRFHGAERLRRSAGMSVDLWIQKISGCFQ